MVKEGKDLSVKSDSDNESSAPPRKLAKYDEKENYNDHVSPRASPDRNDKELPSSYKTNDLTNVSSSSSLPVQMLPSYLTNSTPMPSAGGGYPQFEPFEGYSSLAKQYDSASTALQNFSASTARLMENINSKYNFDHNNASSKLYEDRASYFPQTEFNSLIQNKLPVTSSSYQQFAPMPTLHSNFNGATPNLISSKSLSSSAFHQFSPTFHPSLVSSSYTTLGSYPPLSSYDPFNSKLGAADSLNNNYMPMGQANLLSEKIPPYSQASVHIYPPYVNNFSSHHSGLTDTPYNNGASSLLPTENSTIHPPQSSEPVPASPFSPTLPLGGSSTTPNPAYDPRIPFDQTESSFNNMVYCDMPQQPQQQQQHGGQATSNYNNNTANSEKYTPSSRRNRTKSSGTSKKSAKAKKNSQDEPEHNLQRIFIWDLDETIIILSSLITGEYAQKFGKDVQTTATLGLRIEEIMYSLATSHLFLNDLEECDQTHMEDVTGDDNGQDLSEYNFEGDGFNGGSTNMLQFPSNGRRGVDWMRKLAYRYRRVREVYSNHANEVEEMLGLEKRDQWIPLQMELEQLSGSWHSLAHKSLSIVERRSNCMNIVVSKSHIIHTLAKCLLYGLAGIFPADNIYSSAKVGKESCFQRIQARFGRKCTYVVIGNRDDEIASKQLAFPFWRVTNHTDLINLQHALELGHL